MTTKQFLGATVNTSTLESVRTKADNVGVPVSALVDLLLRYGLAKLSDEDLRSWAAKREFGLGRPVGGMTKAERAVLFGLEALEAKGEGTRFSLVELAASAGLPPRTAYAGLKSLQRRGMVAGSESEPVDRWGRPVESFWWRSTQAESASR